MGLTAPEMSGILNESTKANHDPTANQPGALCEFCPLWAAFVDARDAGFIGCLWRIDPMTFDEHWERLLDANPAMRDADMMTLSVDRLKFQLERAYKRGFQEGQAVEKEDDPLGDLFDMFRQMKG